MAAIIIVLLIVMAVTAVKVVGAIAGTVIAFILAVGFVFIFVQDNNKKNAPKGD